MGLAHTNGFRGSAAFFALLLAAIPGLKAPGQNPNSNPESNAGSNMGGTRAGEGSSQESPADCGAARLLPVAQRITADAVQAKTGSKFSRRRLPFLPTAGGNQLSA